MSAAPARIHVTFSAAARLSLMQAFERLGLKEEVLALVDDLGYGPIEPGTLEQRDAWIDEELGIEADPWRAEKIPSFWERVTTSPAPLVAWLSTRCADEHCGLLELLHRVRETPVSVVDAAEIAEDFAVVRSDVIVDRKLIERIAPVTDADRARHAADWARLRGENAPLRVLTPDGLVSAPITYFDDALLAHVTGDWQPCSRVIAATIKKLAEGRYRQPDSEDLLFARLLALTDDDAAGIEGQNDEEYWAMRTSRVRRRPA
jgi:hypothetical protein